MKIIDENPELTSLLEADFGEVEVMVIAKKLSELSANQRQFVEDAKAQGLEVDLFYSGRGMYGKTCPAVRVDGPADFSTTADCCSDAMGRRIVIYASC